jgi:proline iminopeptidase
VSDVVRDEWYLRTPDGCHLYVKELGDGPETLLVVHGGFGSEHSYLLPALQGLDLPFRFVFYDQRGSLRSPAALSSISVDQHLTDLDLVRRELGLERVRLFGHSMGTLLSMMYAARHVERVEGLVLVSPMLPLVPLPQDLAAARSAHVEAVQARRERRVAEEIHRAGLDRETLTDREETWRSRIEFAGWNVYHVERWRELRGGGAFVNVEAGEKAGATLPSSWDLRSSLDSVRSPITVILGEHDWTPPSVGRELFGGVSDCELVVVSGAGHYVWVDQPERFRSEMVRALTGHTAA